MDSKGFHARLAPSQSPLFSLPRELRDLIYHHCCLDSHELKQQFVFPTPPTPSTATPSNPYYAHNMLALRYRSPRPDAKTSAWFSSRTTLVWLLTCKTVMHEGLEQFLRNAEWYYNGALRGGGRWTRDKLSLLRLETSMITRFELQVENLANYESPARGQGTNTKQDLEYIASLMRTGGLAMHTISFVGHSYRLDPMRFDCDGQIENMAHNLVDVFEGIEVKRWEFGISDPRRDMIWVLFHYVPPSSSSSENSRGQLTLMEKKKMVRMPREVKEDDDLEKLLPEGWVKKRDPCECEYCQDQRKEGGEGGYKERQDEFGPQPHAWGLSHCSRYWQHWRYWPDGVWKTKTTNYADEALLDTRKTN